jgi:hypothetical protein
MAKASETLSNELIRRDVLEGIPGKAFGHRRQRDGARSADGLPIVDTDALGREVPSRYPPTYSRRCTASCGNAPALVEFRVVAAE